MLIELSEEDSKKYDDHIQQLRLGNTKEKITAIIMDSSIGGFGCWESISEEKAEAIMQIIESKPVFTDEEKGRE